MMKTPHSCSICADAAGRAVILSIREQDAEVTLASTGQLAIVAIDLIVAPQVGDWVLVHQGVALVKVAESDTSFEARDEIR